MKMKITHPNGTIEEFDGSAEELVEFEHKRAGDVVTQQVGDVTVTRWVRRGHTTEAAS